MLDNVLMILYVHLVIYQSTVENLWILLLFTNLLLVWHSHGRHAVGFLAQRINLSNFVLQQKPPRRIRGGWWYKFEFKVWISYFSIL